MNNNFNKNFKLNGNAFTSKNELIAYSKTTSISIRNFLKDWFDDQATISVQTSGSTGKPKTIELKKEYIINSAKATGAFFNLEENTTALLCLSTDYIAGKMMLVRALTLGWQLDVVKVVSSPLKGLNKRYDFSAMVPVQVRNSLTELHNIKKLIVGGGPIDDQLLEILQPLPTEIFATYGMTETITHIAVKKLNGSGIWLSVPDAYELLPYVKISTDSRDCLVINASNISDEKIITNDLVKVISETEFIWLGRFDNVINSGGVKLIPEQIEEKLAKIIKQRFFVAGIPDKLFGEKLILIIEGKKAEINKEQLVNRIESLVNLTKYEIPKGIYFTEKCVETETKKIQRQKTLELIFSKK